MAEQNRDGSLDASDTSACRVTAQNPLVPFHASGASARSRSSTTCTSARRSPDPAARRSAARAPRHRRGTYSVCARARPRWRTDPCPGGSARPPGMANPERIVELGLLRAGGARDRPAGAARRGARRRADRARVGVPVGAVQREGGGDAVRRGGGRVRGGRHRHRCHQHADAPPAGDGGVGQHDARAHPRPLRARHRPGHRAAARHHGHPADHDGADGGRRRDLPAALEGRGGDGPRRPGGEVPAAHAGQRDRRRHPGDGRVPRLQDDALGRPRARRRDPAHLRHRRGAGPLRGRGARRCRGGRARPGVGEGLGGARDAPRARPRAPAARRHRPDGDLLPGLRRRPRHDERLGPGAARGVPRRSGGAVGAGRDRRRRHHRAARAHPDPHPRGVAARRGRVGRRRARSGSSTSSPPAPTA